MAAEFADHTRDKRANPVLNGEQPFGLAVFSPNMAGGTNLTRASGPPVVTWEESLALVRQSEAAGFDAVIPVARWRSATGDPRPEANRSFEAFTWAAGVAASTEHIGVFATFHIPTMHPVRAAKEIATLDHISGGRLGVNVVAGWNADEFAMFDQTLAEHDQRYERADEWMSFLERVFTEAQPFDVEGTWYRSADVVSQPLPVQDPGPVIMSAGFSPAGRAFAARHADINFAIISDRDHARTAIAEAKREARERWGREMLVYGAAHVLCRTSEAEADAEYDRVVRQLGDLDGARHAVRLLTGGSQSAAFDQTMLESAIFGFFATPLVGTPEQVASSMAEMATDGLDGLALSWVDYQEGIAQFESEIQPLLIERGLRRGRIAGGPASEKVQVS